MSDRIHFAGNPWPNGHVLENLTWRARLEAGPRLWFTLDLTTTKYAQEGPGDESSQGGDWTSPLVWTNYSRCTMGSSGGGGHGFLVADRDRPLRLADLAGQEFRVDDDLQRPSAVDHVLDPDDEYDPSEIEDYLAFGIYLLGHDSVADHRIGFPRRHAGNEFSLDWRGRIALAYVGEYEYEHEFQVVAERVRLRDIVVAPGVEPRDASALLAQVLDEAGEYAPSDDGLLLRHRG